LYTCTNLIFLAFILQFKHANTFLGDLFDMLLPMLVIYQEYVRNHHYSLQVLAECKQKAKFAQILKRLEEKPLLQSRSLETYLTYPMHQVFIQFFYTYTLARYHAPCTPLIEVGHN